MVFFGNYASFFDLLPAARNVLSPFAGAASHAV
jgi:hypothetical protein